MYSYSFLGFVQIVTIKQGNCHSDIFMLLLLG